MHQGLEFFTATCLNWQPLLREERHKQIVLESLQFLVKKERIWLYGYVLMPNHLHLLWRKQDAWVDKSVQQQFLKFTAQMIKFNLINNCPGELNKYLSTQADRAYHFWERRPYKTTMMNRPVLEQKLDYMHDNPVKAGLCSLAEDYKYSSAGFYLNNMDELNILTHYMEHI
jgi:REP element-mobilizing transposase RayT